MKQQVFKLQKIRELCKAGVIVAMRWLVLKNYFTKLLVAMVVAILTMAFQYDGLEGRLYNFKTRLLCDLGRCSSETQSKIEIVYINRDLFDQYGSAALTPDTWIMLAKNIAESGPRVVAFLDFDSNFLLNESHKIRFKESLSKVPSVIMGTQNDPIKKQINKVDPIFQDRFLGGLQIASRDIESFAQDGVSRRAFYQLNGSDTFSTLVAKEIVGEKFPFQGIFEVVPKSSVFQFYTHYSALSSFKTHDARQILEGKIPRLKNKIVIVAVNDPSSNQGNIKTPFLDEEGKLLEVPLAEIKANEITTLIDDKSLRYVNGGLSKVLLYAATIATSIFAFVASPTIGILLTLGLLAFIIVSSIALFAAGIWIMTVPALVGSIVTYYVTLPFRLISENRRRWELQKQHSLLLEVEELKSNFMSLVSHDLKTPVARIQGMAELGLDDPSVDNNPRQKQVLQGILRSSHELLQFIGNILSLSRVESGALQLNIQSADLNTVAEKAVLKLKDLAQAKSIMIEMKLEPLFAIKCDAILIEQVIYNLVQNAILYSSTGSTVTLKTEEVSTSDSMNPLLRISVQDQGIGIEPADLDRIFHKFYRGRHPNKISTKGSGLGLYLVKYFVELHGGQISVSSEIGKGSTFVVTLPSLAIEQKKQDQKKGLMEGLKNKLSKESGDNDYA